MGSVWPGPSRPSIVCLVYDCALTASGVGPQSGGEPSSVDLLLRQRVRRLTVSTLAEFSIRPVATGS